MSELKIIDPAKDDRWDNFVEKHHFGWICHLSGWKIVLEKTFNHLKGYYLILFNNNNIIRAALPIYEVKSWLTGHRLVSIPFTTLSDPLISSDDDMKKLFNATIRLSKELCTNYIEIRTNRSFSLIQNLQIGFNRYFKHHYLLLENPPEQLKKNFHRTCVRQRISRAINSNIKLKIAENENDLGEFFQLYLITRKRLGLPPQPYNFFKSLWNIFQPKKMIQIFITKKQSQSIAGLLLLKFKDRVSAEVAVFDKEFRDVSPLHFLFWEAIKSAYEEGYRIFDFGRTSPYNHSLMNFKSRWGTKIVDLPYLYYPKEMCGKITKKEKSLSYNLIKNICHVSPQPIFQSIGKFLYQHMS